MPGGSPSAWRAQEDFDKAKRARTAAATAAAVNLDHFAFATRHDGPGVSNIPKDIPEAKADPESDSWMDAVDAEVESHRINKTFDMVPDEGQPTIGSLMIFDRKADHAGNETRKKARWAARGDQQTTSCDTFSATPNMTTIRFVLVMAVLFSLTTRHLDVVTAFLIPFLKQPVWMRPPRGMRLPRGYILRLNKCIYGLRQASRRWYENLHDTLTAMGFTPTDFDPCLYIRIDHRGRVYLVFHVDDILIAGPTAVVELVCVALKTAYRMKDMGAPTFFLGIRVACDLSRGVLTLTQHAYVVTILKRFRMQDCKPASTPADSSVSLTKDDCPSNEEEMYKAKEWSHLYMALVGALLYLALGTRPDIAYAVGVLTRFMQNPGEKHWNAAKYVLRYLKGTADFGLRYTRTTLPTMTGWSDANFVDKGTCGKSTGGYVFILLSAALSWKSKLMSIPATSTCEAEIMAIHFAACEAIWLLKGLRALGVKYFENNPMTMMEDNQGCIAVTKNHKTSHRTKYIETKFFKIRTWVESGELEVQYSSTHDMVADIFTKALQRVTFIRHRSSLGVVRIIFRE